MANTLLTPGVFALGLVNDIENTINSIENSDPNAFLLRMKTAVLDIAPRLLGVLVILAFSHVFTKMFVKFIKKILIRSKIDPTLHNFILGVIKISIWVLAVIMCLIALNVPVSPLITVIGSVGLALSLALKDSLTNVAGGISILFNRPFAKGDLIGITLGINTIVGTVQEIDLFYTKVTTDDGRTVYLTNGDVAKAIVTNYSSDPLGKLDLMFFIPVESSFEKAKEIISSVLSSSAYTLTQPAPIISISGRNEDSYSISCKVWVKAEHCDTIGTPLHEGIDLKLRQSGM